MTGPKIKAEEKTDPILGSKTSDVLYTEIQADSEYLKLRQYNLITAFLPVFAGIAIIIEAARIVTWLLVSPRLKEVNDASVFVYVIICIFLTLALVHYFTNSLIISDIGVGRVNSVGKKVAIRWDHISYIEINFVKDELFSAHFFGNARKISHFNSHWGTKMTFQQLRNYIPDLDDWRTISECGRIGKLVRYMRTTGKEL
jgi:hypothetical protein